MKRFDLSTPYGVPKLEERQSIAAFLRGQGDECPMSWFANSPLYWNLLLVHGTGYLPPYERPAPVRVAPQMELFQ